MANPFYVEPASPLKALMAFDQSYQGARKRTQEDEAKAALQKFAAENPQLGPIAQLIGGNNVPAAQAVSNMELAREGQQHRQAQLAETSRHNRVMEGQPVVVPEGSGLMTRSGNVIREPNLGETALLDDETVDFMAQQYRAGDTSVVTNLGRGKQGAANIVKLRKAIARLNSESGDTGQSQAVRNAEFFGTKAGQRTLGTRTANIELAATELKQVIPVVMEASKAVDRTRFSDFNKIMLAFKERTGDPNVVKFSQGINTLINLYGRAISPTGVATVHDKEHAREVLQKAWSQGQFEAAIQMMQAEVDAALTSPDKVRDEMRRRFLGGTGGQTETPKNSGGVVDWKTYFGAK